MLLDLLLPAVPGLQLETYSAEADGITLMMQTSHLTAACPLCHQASNRIHSHYERTIADLPWADMPVQLVLTVRRFFCDNETCCRKIFVERLGQAIAVYARRTQRLKTRLEQLAFRLGGEAGARTISEWNLSASATTLIRLIRTAELPQSSTPRVLGVDDWAKRKGQTYGTILVDLEQHRPIELLPDASAGVLAEWLKAHPGVEIISRDRATIYAQGARDGAPEAIQVVDRFHLLQNMTDTLKRFLDHHPKILQETARRAAEQAAATLRSETATAAEPAAPAQATALGEPTEVSQSEPATIVASSLVTTPATPILRPGEIVQETPPAQADKRLSGREQRFAQVKALQQQGWSQRKITRYLGLSRPTIRRYWDYETYPQPIQGHQATSTVLPYLDYLTERWLAGCHNRQQLHQELQQKYQYKGSYSSIRRAVRQIINRIGQQPSADKIIERGSRPLSARQAAWLLMSPSEKLKPEQELKRQLLCKISPTVDHAYQLAQSFAGMIRERKAGTLDNWLDEAVKSGIKEFKNFAVNLRRDYQAVKAALELPWSNGPTEAQVHRLKLIKRQMYGRANFDLLRRRVLHPN